VCPDTVTREVLSGSILVEPKYKHKQEVMISLNVRGKCRVVLPQFRIVVIAVKSVYLNKK
jgi:hypothetical protein